MNKRTVISIIAVILGILVIVSLIELLIKSRYDAINHPVSEIPVEPTPSERQQTKEDHFIEQTDEVLSLLQKKDYQSIYERFPEDYKAAKYPSFEDFKESMDSIIHENSTIEIDDIFEHIQGYMAIIKVDNEKEVYFVVNHLDTDNMTIMLDDVVSITKMERFVGTDTFEIDFQYNIDYLSKVGYTILLRNQTNNTVHFEVLRSTNGYSYNRYDDTTFDLIDKVDVSIEPSESKLVEIQLPVGYTERRKPDVLEFHYAINNENYTTDIAVGIEEYESDYDDM